LGDIKKTFSVHEREEETDERKLAGVRKAQEYREGLLSLSAKDKPELRKISLQSSQRGPFWRKGNGDSAEKGIS